MRRSPSRIHIALIIAIALPTRVLAGELTDDACCGRRGVAGILYRNQAIIDAARKDFTGLRGRARADL